MICGAPGSGTSLVTKILRHMGLFAGADAGPMDSRKFHESASFRNVNEQLLAATIKFPHAPKSVRQFRTHVVELEKRLSELIEAVDLSQCVKEFWADNKRVNHWGWKDPRNAANVLFWRNVFPKLRLILIRKKWKWSERKQLGSLAGNWYRGESTWRIRRCYQNPPHSAGLDVFRLDFDKFLEGDMELNRLWNWLRIDGIDKPNFQQMLSAIGIEDR